MFSVGGGVRKVGVSNSNTEPYLDTSRLFGQLVSLAADVGSNNKVA